MNYCRASLESSQISNMHCLLGWSAVGDAAAGKEWGAVSGQESAVHCVIWEKAQGNVKIVWIRGIKNQPCCSRDPTPDKWWKTNGCIKDVVTCDLDQYGFALHPGPGVIIAVPRTAAVKPRLLWAQAGHKKGSAAVGEGVATQERLNTSVHVCLRGEDRSIQQPGHTRESPPADSTPQSGSSHSGICSIEIIQLHYHIAPHWDWSNRRQERRPSRQEERTAVEKTLYTRTHDQSDRLTRQILHLVSHPTPSRAHIQPRYHGNGEPGGKGISRCDAPNFPVI